MIEIRKKCANDDEWGTKRVKEVWYCTRIISKDRVRIHYSFTQKSIGPAVQCRRASLVTTSDNMDALRFYQQKGFMPSALHLNAIQQSRENAIRPIRLGGNSQGDSSTVAKAKKPV